MELEEYDRIAGSEATHWWYRATRAVMSDALTPWLRPGIDVLDAGCGPGGNGAWLLPLGRVVGLDTSREALRLLRSRHPAVESVEGTVEAMPFPDAAFDVVLAITVLNLVEDDTAAAGEIARVLRPGGVALVLEPALPALRRGHDEVVHTRRRYRVNELAARLAAQRLVVRRATYCHSYLAPPAAVLALLDQRRSREAQARSDLERPRFDAVFSALAAAERRLLRRRDVPFGLSALVVAERPATTSG